MCALGDTVIFTRRFFFELLESDQSAAALGHHQKFVLVDQNAARSGEAVNGGGSAEIGHYILNLERKPPQPDYGYTLRQTISAARNSNGPFL
jgi:hypothetical protein